MFSLARHKDIKQLRNICPVDHNKYSIFQQEQVLDSELKHMLGRGQSRGGGRGAERTFSWGAEVPGRGMSGLCDIAKGIIFHSWELDLSQ